MGTATLPPIKMVMTGGWFLVLTTLGKIEEHLRCETHMLSASAFTRTSVGSKAGHPNLPFWDKPTSVEELSYIDQSFIIHVYIIILCIYIYMHVIVPSPTNCISIPPPFPLEQGHRQFQAFRELLDPARARRTTKNSATCESTFCKSSLCHVMSYMHVGVYNHVCVCVYGYVRTYVRTYVCMYVCMYIYIYICIHTYSTTTVTWIAGCGTSPGPGACAACAVPLCRWKRLVSYGWNMGENDGKYMEMYGIFGIGI